MSVQFGQASYQSIDIASAATVNLSAVTHAKIRITGTTNISAITMKPHQLLFVIFTGILTITHNATTLNLPNGGADIITAAGDRCVLAADGSANVTVWHYQRASGAAVAAAAGDVVGPAGTFDNRIVRFDGGTGKLIQDCTASIDDAGNAGINGRLAIAVTSNSAMTVTRIGGSLAAFAVDTSNASGANGIEFVATPAGTGAALRATSTAADEALNFNAKGAGTIVLGGTSTGNIVCARPLDVSNANSGQIVFPATQNPSAGVNTLDDYREATFTPTLTFGGGSTGMTGTFSGRYTRIGRRVMGTAQITLTAKGTSTGAAQIGNLPFAQLGGLSTPTSLYMTGLNAVTGVPQARIQSSATAIDLALFNGSTNVLLTDAGFTNTTIIFSDFSYDAA